MPPVPMPVTYGRKSHGGESPLRYMDSDLHPQRFLLLGLRTRRKFLYEIEESVMDIFGTNTDGDSQ